MNQSPPEFTTAVTSPTNQDLTSLVSCGTISTMGNPTSSMAAPDMKQNIKAKNPAPQRCVSAFNIFFMAARKRLVAENIDQGPYTRAEVYSIRLDKESRAEKSKRPHRKMHGVISFTELARQVADQWKVLDADQKRLFEERADEEKAKYAVELEEWLLTQVPTPQIKKRLSALRRGSLGKFVSSKRKAPTSPSPSASRLSSTPSSSYSSYSSFTAPAQAVVAPKPCPLVDAKRSRQQIQLERARNLQRLYQMQIDLYNEQMRLHEECKQDLGAPTTMNSYESTTHHHHHYYDHEEDRFYDHHHHATPEMGRLQDTRRFVSSSELHWDQHDPVYDDHQFAPHHHHHSLNQGFDMPVQSPFHDHIDGRVSPFGSGNEFIA